MNKGEKMAADFFEKDFNFEKYISERLLEIDDEKRVWKCGS